MFFRSTGRRSSQTKAGIRRSRSDRSLLPVTYFRPLRCECLEDRRLLSIGTSQIELFNTSPALFVENQGQWDDDSVRYVHQGAGASIAMADEGIRFQLIRAEDTELTAELRDDSRLPSRASDFDLEETTTEVLQFSATFAGANSTVPVGQDRAETVFNYFVGDQANWREAVPTYEVVAYEDLYDGIDLLTWGQLDSLKYEFHVAPGADYRQIRVRYEGIEGLSIDAQGALHIQTSLGELVDDAPRIHQTIDGRQVAVPGRFELADAFTCSFVLTEDYDPSVELVIDPDLAWATYVCDTGSNVQGLTN